MAGPSHIRQLRGGCGERRGGLRGLSPALQLPMLAGVAQGVGFPSLSCLGLLADPILSPYTIASTAARPPVEAAAG